MLYLMYSYLYHKGWSIYLFICVLFKEFVSRSENLVELKYY